MINYQSILDSLRQRLSAERSYHDELHRVRLRFWCLYLAYKAHIEEW